MRYIKIFTIVLDQERWAFVPLDMVNHGLLNMKHLHMRTSGREDLTNTELFDM